MGKRFFRTAPMFFIMGAVFILSHQPGDTFEMLPFFWSDKLIHLAVYAVLAASVLYALPDSFKENNRKTAVIAVVVICFFYGCTDEFHQSFIPGRFSSLGDIMADGAGAIVFCAGWLIYLKKVKR